MLKEIWEMINEAVLNSTIGYHNIFIFMGHMMVLELTQNMNAFGVYRRQVQIYVNSFSNF